MIIASKHRCCHYLIIFHLVKSQWGNAQIYEQQATSCTSHQCLDSIIAIEESPVQHSNSPANSECYTTAQETCAVLEN